MTDQLPKKQDDNVVDVSLGHVLLGLLALSATCLVVGTTLILTRDYVKYRRHRAIADMATQLIQTISEQTKWNEIISDA